MQTALVTASRYRADRKGEAGIGKRLEVLRESSLHVRPVERDEDDDDSRVDGLASRELSVSCADLARIRRALAEGWVGIWTYNGRDECSVHDDAEDV